MMLTSPYVPWVVRVEGDDLVVHNVVATCFGGKFDKGDNGQTESGVMNDGRDKTLMGVALPIRSTEAATRHSPLAFSGPHIPWKSAVRVWRNQDGEENGIDCILIDNGPDISKYPTHALDLNPNVAARYAPAMAEDKLPNAWSAMGFNYRILGAAKFISLLLISLLLCACGTTPVVISRAVPVKAVDTAPIKRSLDLQKKNIEDANAAASAVGGEIARASNALPATPQADGMYLLTAEAYEAMKAAFVRGTEQILKLTLSMQQIENQRQAALEARAAAQEVANAEHVQVLQLADANNAAKLEIADLQAAKADAAAGEHLAWKIVTGMTVVIVLYGIAKFYFHVPFL